MADGRAQARTSASPDQPFSPHEAQTPNHRHAHPHTHLCHSFTVPSSEPVRMRGSSGWKQTVEMLWEWPSSVWMHALVW